MPLVRMIISSRPSATAEAKDAIVNTVYFNVSGSVDAPDYQKLVDDLWDQWDACPWSRGRFLDIRAYNMDDPEPRPVKARKVAANSGSAAYGPNQVALCLSYYADRNLPRQRGRLYLGPWTSQAVFASTAQQNDALLLADRLSGIGGVNVDWSLWSPTTQTHTRINHAWVDNSWDIIRSRKLKGTARVEKTLNG